MAARPGVLCNRLFGPIKPGAAPAARRVGSTTTHPPKRQKCRCARLNLERPPHRAAGLPRTRAAARLFPGRADSPAIFRPLSSGTAFWSALQPFPSLPRANSAVSGSPKMPFEPLHNGTMWAGESILARLIWQRAQNAGPISCPTGCAGRHGRPAPFWLLHCPRAPPWTGGLTLGRAQRILRPFAAYQVAGGPTPGRCRRWPL